MRSRLLVRLFAILIVSAAAIAGPASAQQACSPPAVSDKVHLTVAPRADNGLVADASVELAAAAPVYLEYGTDKLGWLRTPTDEAKTSHKLPIIRLRAKTPYQVRAFALDGAGCPTVAATAQFTSGDVPPQFQKLIVESSGPSSVPLMLMDLRVTVVGEDNRWLVALDKDWQPVWYYTLPRVVLRAAVGRGVNGVVKLANGNFLYLARNFGLEEITPDGRVARRVHMEETEVHHDLIQLPDGRVMFIGAEERVIDDTPNGGPTQFTVRGDTLDVIDLDQDQTQEVWSAFDMLDPLQREPQWGYRIEDGAQEWTHANSISLGARGNVILSFRHLDQIISLSPDLQKIEWKLGGPGSTFTFPDPTDRFYGQHAAIELPNGHILMFDNGNFRPEGDYSRALELELDPNAKTARKVWEYRHQPDIFAASQSNAIRLESGNTLINFGFPAGPDEPNVLTEARPDGTVAWEMALRLEGQNATRYRVYPLTALGGEQSVEPTKIAGAIDAGL